MKSDTQLRGASAALQGRELDALIAEKVHGPFKFCRGCQRELPIAEFSVCRRAPDGLDWRCRSCKRVFAQRYIHSEKGKQTRRAFQQAHRGEDDARRRMYRARYAEKYPEKVRARDLLGNAVRKGYIPKPSPDRHWDNIWDFHHPDHSRPYYGAWVKRTEHSAIDRGKVPCPPCADYSKNVRDGLLADWGLL